MRRCSRCASVLLLALLVGLLLGHWVTQSGKNQPQVVKLEGLGGLAAAQVDRQQRRFVGAERRKAASSGSEEASRAQQNRKEEESRSESRRNETCRPAESSQSDKTQLDKLEKSTGKKHEEELNKIGTSPIAMP